MIYPPFGTQFCLALCLSLWPFPPMLVCVADCAISDQDSAMLIQYIILRSFTPSTVWLKDVAIISNTMGTKFNAVLVTMTTVHQ